MEEWPKARQIWLRWKLLEVNIWYNIYFFLIPEGQIICIFHLKYIIFIRLKRTTPQWCHSKSNYIYSFSLGKKVRIFRNINQILKYPNNVILRVDDYDIQTNFFFSEKDSTGEIIVYNGGRTPYCISSCCRISSPSDFTSR